MLLQQSEQKHYWKFLAEIKDLSMFYSYFGRARCNQNMEFRASQLYWVDFVMVIKNEDLQIMCFGRHVVGKDAAKSLKFDGIGYYQIWIIMQYLQKRGQTRSPKSNSRNYRTISRCVASAFSCTEVSGLVIKSE